MPRRRPAKPAPDPQETTTLSVLLDVMSSLAAERDLDAVLEKITAKASEVMRADRSTLFLVDETRQEIWSKVAQGAAMSEIRVPLGTGIAGHVARTGETVNIPDAYRDPRFNREVDRKTRYRTRTILCMPMKDQQGRIIGVLQILNKQAGAFTPADEELLEAFAAQAAIAVRNALLNDQLHRRMRTSEILLNVMHAVSAELEIDQLLQKIVGKTSEAMEADRCTLFLVDRKTGELWSKVAQGVAMKGIRVPRGAGIVGHVATSGETVNIPDAYKDPRFNKEVDRRTGYRTESILCMPVRNERGEIVAVMQVLNKRGGPFTRDDEQLLDALGSQTAVALENAHLFEEVRRMKNYTEGILRTIATGVITLDPAGNVVYRNQAGGAMFAGGAAQEGAVHHKDFFRHDLNQELTEGVESVLQGADSFVRYELDHHRANDEPLRMNVSVLPLHDSEQQSLGLVVVADDITQEQRLMSTLCRYMSRQLAEQVMKDRSKLKLGGQRSKVAVLFSDIRNFTTLTEQQSAEEVVAMLNDYFSRMVGPVFHYEGTLDKYIGDAIMAVFGAPVSRPDDGERAVRAALEMRRALRLYNLQRVRHGLAPIEIGIGITKGEAISGNIGAELRMDYTVIGDTVNLASRLEGLTKNYDYKILVNEDIYQEIKEKIPCVNLGFAQIKGKGERITVFGVVDPAENRASERCPSQFEVRYGANGTMVAAQGYEISEGGMCFLGPEPLGMDEETDVHYRLDPGEDWVATRAIVRRSSRTRISVQFLALDSAEKLRIGDFVLTHSGAIATAASDARAL